MEAVEQPLSAAFAVGAMATASMAIAAMVKVFAMLLRVMMNLLWLVDQVANPAHLPRIRNRGLEVTASWAKGIE